MASLVIWCQRSGEGDRSRYFSAGQQRRDWPSHPRWRRCLRVHWNGELDDWSFGRGVLDSSKAHLNSHRRGKFQGRHFTFSDDLPL